jgi:small conductance mechanosensitive channel
MLDQRTASRLFPGSWIDPPRRRDAVDALDYAIANVKDALTAAGIDLPYPTSQVLFHDQTEETDGDRTRQREGWPAGSNPPRALWQVLRTGDKAVQREKERA